MNFTISPAADKFMRRMVRLAGGGGFRLVVSPGGCSGLASEFTVEAEPKPNDATVDFHGLKVFLPTESRLLLDGVTIDFAETPMESGFVFRSPKMGSACSSHGQSHAPQKLVSLKIN